MVWDIKNEDNKTNHQYYTPPMLKDDEVCITNSQIFNNGMYLVSIVCNYTEEKEKRGKRDGVGRQYFTDKSIVVVSFYFI